MKTAIVWFKTDLRLEDNEALLKAIAHGDKLPVYCFDDKNSKLRSMVILKQVVLEHISIGIFN
jgi:deoxyribodipyrimidine photo-lyase